MKVMTTVRVTSQSNPGIKAIRKLRNKKERDVSGLAYLEGLKIVGEAVEQGAAIQEIIWSPELLSSDFGISLVKGCAASGMVVIEVSHQVFESISLKDNPQGIAAVIKQRTKSLAELGNQPADFGIALYSVADPGNLGTIIRTCDAVGCRHLFLLDQTTDPFDPSSIRASMGALFSVNIVKASISEFVGWAKKNAIPVIGTSDKASHDYLDFDYPNRMIFLMGSEREGIPENILELCSSVVRIPMVGRSDSLNLSIASSILLYEYFNRMRVKPAHTGQ